jgi:transcriptional regulator with XRE-family HTH domain
MLGKVIAEKRNKLGWTQRDVAAKLGISFQYLCDIELGKRSPSDDYFLEMIAATLGLSQDYLYFLAGRLPSDIRQSDVGSEAITEGFKAMRTVLRSHWR